MRRAALILSLSLAFAAPVGAQPAKGAQPLRGAQPAKQLPAPAPPAVSLATPAPMPPPDLAPEAGRCRLTCAQSYYFCLTSDTPDDCPGVWSQCRAACDAPIPPAGR